MRDKKPMAEVDLIFQNKTQGGGCWFEREDGEDICLPLSRIEIHGEQKRGRAVVVVLDEDLAIEKGLV